MKTHIKAVFGALLACASVTANAAWETTPQAYVGSMHGTASACKRIMPDAVRLGLAEMNSEFEAMGVDLAQFAASNEYKKAYAEEVAQVSSLDAEEQVKACDWIFEKWKATGKPLRPESAAPLAKTPRR
jgi:hypothetical protein